MKVLINNTKLLIFDKDAAHAFRNLIMLQSLKERHAAGVLLHVKRQDLTVEQTMSIVRVLVTTALEPLVDSTLRHAVVLSIQSFVSVEPVSWDSQFTQDELFVILLEVALSEDLSNLVLKDFEGHPTADVVVKRVCVRDQMADNQSHSPVVLGHQLCDVLAAGSDSVLGVDEVLLQVVG